MPSGRWQKRIIFVVGRCPRRQEVLAAVLYRPEWFMFPFIQLPYRSSHSQESGQALPQWTIVLVLLLILLVQLGLLLLLS